MRAQTAFAQNQNNQYMPHVTDNTWHIALAVIIISVLIAAHSNGAQSALANMIEGSTTYSNAIDSNVAELGSSGLSSTEHHATAETAWPYKVLTERVEKLNFTGRVAISAPKASPQITIRTDLLFSEGDGLLSRAGKFTLDKLFADLRLPATTVIQLKDRKNTEVEFTHGVQMQTLHKNRERSLTEYLSAAWLSVSIVQ